MNDNDVFQIIRAILLQGMIDMGQPGVQVKQAFQPDQTGVPSPPVILLHKIGVQRYGWPKRRAVFNDTTDVFDQTEIFWRAPTFQVAALAIQDPGDLTQLTASDLVEAAADILQLDATLTTLRASQIGIDRITQVRVPYFIDDRDRHEQSPSFDFTLTYQHEITSTVPVVTEQQLNIHRI